jgi:hypothetical protein
VDHLTVIPAKVWQRARRDYATPKVNGKHCLRWQGAKNTTGYPVMRYNGVCIVVTRLILARLVRKFRRREEALHACDVRDCIEPAHLSHGTKARNMREMWSRGRRYRPNTFLLPDD